MVRPSLRKLLICLAIASSLMIATNIFSYNSRKQQRTQTLLTGSSYLIKHTLPPDADEDQILTTTRSVITRRESSERPTTPTVTPEPTTVVTKWCQDTPPYLVGALANMAGEMSPSELVKRYPDLELGGRLRPRNCTPRQRLAILVPYRNRFPHLHIMLNNLVPILTRQQADVTFFVIEQDLPGTFNRGALLNVGFLEAEKLASFDCYIFHDVDMVPLNDHNLYRCGDNPRHFAVAMNKFQYKLYYPGYFGAVVGFSKKQFNKVNGCSNLYFGWGGEDDDLLARLRNKNYTMQRYDPITGRYDMIRHRRDEGNEENLLRRVLRKNALTRQDVEGLNTVKYSVNSIHIERLYTWINVSLNMTDILQTAPSLTMQLMNVEMKKIKQQEEKSAKMKQTKQQEEEKIKIQTSTPILLNKKSI